MDGEIDLHTVPLTSLTYEARNLLYCLLDTTKILLSEGPDKLPRDWRGLATLVNISSEIAGSFERDKTAKVIEHWIQRHDGTATVGRLLEFVQRVDRYDIFDDFVNLQEAGNLFLNQSRPAYPNAIVPRGRQDVEIPDDQIQEHQITFDDKIHNAPQFYHAYVLYAQEDRTFVDEMLIRMREKGYKLCTEDDLLPDHQTTYAPVSRLISSDRCHRIVLIYSPEFLTSPANNFYMDYAQAVGIEMKKPKIIPVMYRACQLPPQVSFYHKLYFNPQGSKPSYDFWERLGYSLDVHVAPPRINGTQSTTSYSTLNITELHSNYSTSNGLPQYAAVLPLPPAPSKSRSMNGIDTLRNGFDSKSSSDSHASEGKTSGLRKMLRSLKFKKKKSSKKSN